MNFTRPISSSASSTRRDRSSLFTAPLCLSGSMTFSRTDIHGNSERLYSWKTSAISSGGSVTILPRRTTSPLLGSSSPAMHLSRVVFPQPDGPTTQTNSPSATANETSPMACVAFSSRPYVFPSPLISSIRASFELLRRGGAPAPVPGERTALEQAEEEVESVTQHSDEHDHRPHRRELERVLRDEEDVADAARRRPVLREHHDDHRERQARAHAGEDLRHRRRQDDAANRLAPGNAVRARRLDERGLDATHTVDRVQEHGEQADERDERHLLRVADRVQQDDRDRDERWRRHGPPVLDVRHRPEARPARETDRDAQRDAHDDGDPEAEQDALDARHDVPLELGEEPQLLELHEDRRETRELGVVRRRRPQLPGGEDGDRDGDLGGDHERPVRALAHGRSSRCDGCQRSTRRSTPTIA